MESSVFKYQSAISKIDNCPSQACCSTARDAYRWVHSAPSADDFVPVALESAVNRRAIDETDLVNRCLTWGLSLYDTKEAATAKFKHIVSYFRPAKRSDFLTQKGDCVAFIPLELRHGHSSPSNNDGHFTLFEYEGVNLLKDIKKTFNIFDDNGETVRPD